MGMTEKIEIAALLSVAMTLPPLLPLTLALSLRGGGDKK